MMNRYIPNKVCHYDCTFQNNAQVKMFAAVAAVLCSQQQVLSPSSPTKPADTKELQELEQCFYFEDDAVQTEALESPIIKRNIRDIHGFCTTEVEDCLRNACSLHFECDYRDIILFCRYSAT